MRSVSEKNKIEIIQTHDFYTNVFGISAALLARVPVKIASKRETGGMRSKLQKTIENRIFKTADAIVVNAAAVKNYLTAEGIAVEKLKRFTTELICRDSRRKKQIVKKSVKN